MTLKKKEIITGFVLKLEQKLDFFYIKIFLLVFYLKKKIYTKFFERSV